MEITFILPLVLLPGVALLIVSSAARYGQIHDEIHRQLDHREIERGGHLHIQARRFRNALVALYLCVALFALASLCGVILELLGISAHWGVVGLTSLGCLSLLYAAYQLIRETMLSLDVIEQHLEHATHNNPPQA